MELSDIEAAGCLYGHAPVHVYMYTCTCYSVQVYSARLALHAVL